MVRVSVVTMTSNALLAVFKLLAGILACSGAMISDGVHTISDVFSTLAVLIGYHFSGKSPDKEHPYGHERIECLVALLLAAMLLILGVGIGFQGLHQVVLHFASARRIHDRIERECPGVKHCMIHVNPYPADERENETTGSLR